MNWLDWVVMLGVLFGIVGYGTYITRKQQNIKSYFLGNNSSSWALIGLSVMATQASAITFISTPGLAFTDGMAFVQNYFGLPLALIVVAVFFIPIYYRLKVYTAYEFLEKRFDLKTRVLAAFLFLVQRGLAAGITIYAPAIILSTMLGWSLRLTIIMVGVLVIVYTVSGGSKAVSITQKWQMFVIMAGMFIAFFIVLGKLPEGIGFMDSLAIAGSMNKMNVVSFSFDPSERYTVWTGILGGFFLALSYFGTDQSQVQRYLGGKSIQESRLGLMFNALFKIPMQFSILLTGVMVFVFFQFNQHSLLFNQSLENEVRNSTYQDEYADLNLQYQKIQNRKKEKLYEWQNNPSQVDKKGLSNLEKESKEIRNRATEISAKAVPDSRAKDSDFVFLSFIMNYMPHGLIGLLLAVIISAAMSSTAGELNALGSTTSIDFYKRIIKQDGTDDHYVFMSKVFTTSWGIIAILFALFAYLVENLIEAVNILGSIFYGVILGIFVVALFLKFIRAKAIFYSALISQFIVIYIFWQFNDQIAYLWLNLIGCFLVVFLSIIASTFSKKEITL